MRVIHWLFVLIIVGCVALLLPLAAGAAPLAQASVLFQDSFENLTTSSGSPNWTYSEYYLFPNSTNAHTAPSAEFVASVDEGGNIYHSFGELQAGLQLELSYYARADNIYDSSSNPYLFRAYFEDTGGDGYAACNVPELTTAWAEYTCSFTVSAGSRDTALGYLWAGGAGIMLDDVTVTASAPIATAVPTATPVPTATTAPPTATPEPPTATTPPGQPTSTLAPAIATPTAIPAAPLRWSSIVSNTRQLADEQATAWSMDDDRHTLFYAFTSLVLGFWVFAFIKALVSQWRGDD